MISLARRYFGFDPPAWRYSPVSAASPTASPASPASPSPTASRNATLLQTLLQTYAGSARLSRVRLIETDALSWLRGAARPYDLLTTNLLAYLRPLYSYTCHDRTGAARPTYDFAVLDAFDTGTGSVTTIPPVFGTAAFADALAAALAPHGVVATQIFPRDAYGKAFRRFCEARHCLLLTNYY